MKIYTKTGDLGETGLFGGPRVKKTDQRLWAYGTVDELNSLFGAVISRLGQLEKSWDERVRRRLIRIQGELFQLGAELATPPEKNNRASLLSTQEIQKLENEIDEMEKSLTPLKTFILPGGCEAGALTHVARTVCRRFERELVQLMEIQIEVRPEVLQYVNRLSDYLFVLARWINQKAKVSETPWSSRS